MRLHAKLLPSCLTLCDPMDCSLPGSSVHGILFHFKSLPWLSILKWTLFYKSVESCIFFFTACIFNTTKSLHAATKNTICYKNDQSSLILQLRPRTAKKTNKKRYVFARLINFCLWWDWGQKGGSFSNTFSVFLSRTYCLTYLDA